MTSKPGSPEAEQHCGRYNEAPLKRFSVQGTLGLDLPQAYTEQALHWRRLRKTAVRLVNARKRTPSGTASCNAVAGAPRRLAGVDEGELGDPFEFEKQPPESTGPRVRTSLGALMEDLQWGK